MKNTFAFFLVTPLAFAAGFLALRLWPSSTLTNSAPPAAKPAEAAVSIPAGTALRGEMSLAARLEAKKRAASLTPETARNILEQCSPPITKEQRPFLTEALRCWAESDSAAAFEWLRRFAKNGSVPYGWDAIALTPLARKDLPAAMAALMTLSDTASSQELLAAAAERDPAGTMAYVEKNSQLAYWAGKAFRVWLQRDPAAACHWLVNCKAPEMPSVRDMFADIAALAPDRLPALLAALPEHRSTKVNALAVLASLEVDRDPAAALAKFPSLSEADRQHYTDPLAMHLATHGKPDEIAGLLKLLGVPDRDNFISKLSDGVAALGPDGVLALTRLPDFTAPEKARLLQNATDMPLRFAEEFMTALGPIKGSDQKDTASRFWSGNLDKLPEETLPVFNRMVADGRVDAALLLDIVAQMSTARLAGVEAMVAGLPDNHRAGPAAMLAVHQVLSGTASDLAAFTSLPDAASRQETLRLAFALRAPEFDAVRRAGFVSQLPPAQQIEALAVMNIEPADSAAFMPLVARAAAAAPDSSNSPDLTRVVSTVARQIPDHTAALQWLATLPAGAARDAGTVSSFATFARTDTIAASAWLAAQAPDVPQRDAMTTGLVKQVLQTDPERAWQWAATIQDSAQRQSTRQEVMTRWRTTDPGAASQAAGEQQP